LVRAGASLWFYGANIGLAAGRLGWRGWRWWRSQAVEQWRRRRAGRQHKLPFQAAAGKAECQAYGKDSGH